MIDSLSLMNTEATTVVLAESKMDSWTVINYSTNIAEIGRSNGTLVELVTCVTHAKCFIDKVFSCWLH